jgi:hypothetical protein
VGETADSGVPEKYSRKGIMTAFIYSAKARKVAPLPTAERRKIVLKELAPRFGPKALAPLDYYEMNWSTQQWTRRCFTGFLTPGTTVLFWLGSARSCRTASVGRDRDFHCLAVVYRWGDRIRRARGQGDHYIGRVL